MKLPGAMIDTSMANVVLGNPEAQVERSDTMLCSADVYMREADLVPEWRPGSEFPSPVLYLTGNVMSIRGDMPHGVTTLVFQTDEEIVDFDGADGLPCPRCGKQIADDDVTCPHCQTRFSAEDKAAMRALMEERRELDSEGVPSIPMSGPPIRFRFEFTPAEKAALVAKGLMEPGFTVPGILTRNLFQDMPVPCSFTTVVPQNPGDVPFTFVEIPNQLCVETSSSQCGYDLGKYFETSKVMQTQADMIAPLEDSMEDAASLGASKDFDDELLDMFEDTELTEGALDLGDTRDEIVEDEMRGPDNEEETPAEEREHTENARAAMSLADIAEHNAVEARERELASDAEMVERIAEGFDLGVSPTEARQGSFSQEAEQEAAAKRAATHRRRIQQMQAEQARIEAEEAEKAAQSEGISDALEL